MVATGNVGVALGLTFAAGLCTTIGACIVFCAQLAKPRYLAGSLGFAAGVMLFVSFAEILMRKSVASFEAVSANGNAAYRWATLCFFGGMLIVFILDRVVHALAHCGARRSHRKAAMTGGGITSTSTANLLSHEDQRNARQRSSRSSGGDGAGSSGTATTPPRVATMPSTTAGAAGRGDVENSGSAANSPRAGTDAAVMVENPLAAVRPPPSLPGSASDGDDDCNTSVSTQVVDLSAPEPLTEPCDAMTSAVVAASCPDTVATPNSKNDGPSGEGEGGAPTSSRTPPAVVEIMEADHHAFMLKKMGYLTALALFIHNFPEGLATFVGALADTKVGVGLAVAIAMHNIPEGICVAMPIYYATGSRWKGFWWAFLSGVSEPVGGIVGYLVLDGNNDLSFAIVFALVAGMMVYISIKELLPTALRYDPQDTIATSAVIAGMVVMAGSLLLFTL